MSVIAPAEDAPMPRSEPRERCSCGAVLYGGESTCPECAYREGRAPDPYQGEQ